MASKTSHAALIWNKHTVESDLWSFAWNKRSAHDLKASMRQLTPHGSCRPWSAMTAFIVSEEVIIDGILTLTCGRKPCSHVCCRRDGLWRIAWFSLEAGGFWQTLAKRLQSTHLSLNAALSLCEFMTLFLPFSFAAHVRRLCGGSVAALLLLQQRGSGFTERWNLSWLKCRRTSLEMSVASSHWSKSNAFLFTPPPPPRRLNYSVPTKGKGHLFLWCHFLNKQCGNGRVMGR